MGVRVNVTLCDGFEGLIESGEITEAVMVDIQDKKKNAT